MTTAIDPPYPPIDPTTFDLIIIGTGLPSSVIAAASSLAGKSVLHLDPNPFYGSHFSSLSFPDLPSFLDSHFSDLELSNFDPQLIDQHSRKFNLDVSGPRVLFCADKCIDLMLKSGASQYVEFKSVDATFIADGAGGLGSVPDSRAAIFKDKSLSLLEKNQLMRFFKLVQGHLSEKQDDVEGNEIGAKISQEEMETPFVEFLTKMKLPPKIKSIILYAIAMADYDQERAEIGRGLLRTKDGIERLALYSASIGRFQNALGALIYPIYGQGELPQAFCRRAAVKGCIYVLRMPVASLLKDEDSVSYKGVRLASGQDILGEKLVVDPSFSVPLQLAPASGEQMQDSPQVSSPDDGVKVARGICITTCSLKPDTPNCLVFFPPRSLFPEQVASIRVLQLSSNLAVCPSGMFVLYFSALCDDFNQGKKLLHAALAAVQKLLGSRDAENNSRNQSEDTEDVKPTLLWSALYIQELNKGQFEQLTCTPMPDGNLNYNNVLDASKKLFQHLYPNEEFFPETTELENPEDDTVLTLDSTKPENPEDDTVLTLDTTKPENPEDDAVLT